MTPTIHITFETPPAIQIAFPAYVQVPVDAGGGGGTGADGNKGWSPVLAVVSDSARRVLQVSDWTGGEGTKPTTGQYIGISGLVATAAEAADIRGATGADGATGPQGPAGPNSIPCAADATNHRLVVVKIAGRYQLDIEQIA